MKNTKILISLFIVISLCLSLNSKQDSAKYKDLDPKFKSFLIDLAKQDGPPIYKLPIKQARKILDDLQKPSYNKIPADIKDIVIPNDKLGKISLTIIRPKNSGDKKLPAVLYFHGGGWILGNKHTHDYLVRQLANNANVAIVFVNYTSSPEAQYPKPIEQGYAALEYIAKNGKKLNLDTNHIAVAGDSVGGNMATVVTILAKERKGPKIDFQLLYYPVTDANFNNKSYRQFEDGLWLTKNSMKWFWNAYAPNLKDRKKHTVTPLNASLEQLKNLPPALIITNENDVLRDEGEAYAKKLMAAGVPVTAIRYIGDIHDLVLLAPLKDTVQAKSAIDIGAMKLKEILHKIK